MTWTPINFEPGVWKDDSPLKAQGFYIDADKIRFVNGLPETIYGWERASATALTGLCRGAFSWQDADRNTWAAFGTHLRLYVMDLDGTVTDITPAIAYSRETISFATTNTSTTVTITGWTHGLVVDQKFKLENAVTATIGGVTIDGTYTVLTVESSTSITFTAAQAATSTAGPTATQVDITTYLAPGQPDGLAGLGYGTGGYGSGGYGGGSSAYDVFPLTWSFDQWGQNLLASPRGDGIYEWAPNVTATELVINGSFSVSTGWSIGTGWSVGGGFATATAGASSHLDRHDLVLNAGAWNLLTLNLSVGAGTLSAYVDGVTVLTGVSSTGNYREPFFFNGGTARISLQKDASFVGSLHDVSVKVLTTAELIPTAPTQVGSMFVTAERIVVACGSNLSGTFDPLQIDWSDAEDNQTWTPTSSNLAGGYTLPGGGRIVRGHRGARENVIWTLESLWSMRYNANPGTVYDLIEMGKGGLIGPNAAAQVGGVWYWMTPAGAFYAYQGSVPQMLPCTLARDVADNLAWVQGDKVYAWANVGKNYAEVWWMYPDSRDGDEVSRYVIYDTLRGTWCCGVFDRSAWTPAGVFQYPLAVDTSGNIWYHEKDFTEDGGPRSWFIDSAFNSDVNGQILIKGVRPDADDLQGGYSITFYSVIRSIVGIARRTLSALSITSSTGQKSVRVRGEQVRFRISGNAAPTFWRMGRMFMDILKIAAKR